MCNDAIHVLIVDDDIVDAELTERALKSVGNPRFVIERTTSLSDAEDRLQNGRFDVVLLDLGLPDSPRAETLEWFRADCPSEFPVIVLTGLDDDRSALRIA